ncbi:hypothetical protein [Leifsonia sp. AG29]|uniref:hypothetical protein n=1 Tax=Leifsonia sp. AG29 TaxID=2598860 RepID=UPI00131D02B4|nr:hypothetical protein [Leifsonia sp. AG29]
MKATRAALSRRLVTRLALCAVFGAAVGACAWYLGMDAAHAAGLGAIALGLTSCLSMIGDAAPVAWAPDPAPARPGSRRDVVQLGWALGARGGRVSAEGMRRVRSLAARALAAHGVDLDDPAHADTFQRLIGPSAVSLVARGAQAPRTVQVEALLARLEELSVSPVRPTEESRHGR